MEVTIICIGLLYFFSHYLTVFFQKTRIPDVLILIIVGILLGPVSGVASVSSFGVLGQVLTSVALIVILFEGGLNLELSAIRGSMRTSAKLTITFFLITAIIVGLIMRFAFHYQWIIAFTLGFIVGGTSSAVVMPMVGMLNMSKGPSTILILESALTDVLCIVFAISFLSSFNTGIVEPGKIIGSLISSLVLASVIGAGAGLFWLRIMGWVMSFPNTQFTTMAFMLVVYGVAEYIGYSGAIASLAFGIVLGNYNTFSKLPYKVLQKLPEGIITNFERRLYKEVVFLLKTYFFIYLGISIPFNDIHSFLIALILVFVIYVARFVTIRFLVKETFHWYEKTIMTIMVPKGLAAAVLAGLPLQYGVAEGPQMQSIVYYVVLLSITATSCLVPIMRIPVVNSFYKFVFSSGKNDEEMVVEQSEPTTEEPTMIDVVAEVGDDAQLIESEDNKNE